MEDMNDTQALKLMIAARKHLGRVPPHENDLKCEAPTAETTEYYRIAYDEDPTFLALLAGAILSIYGIRRMRLCRMSELPEGLETWRNQLGVWVLWQAGRVRGAAADEVSSAVQDFRAGWTLRQRLVDDDI